MKKPAPIQLSIPQPCTQAWEEMQPATGGKHCASCQKVVTDFSRMTDAQLLDYFRTANGAACGRFRTEQLDRLIHSVEVPRSTWWARIAAGLLLALGVSKEAHAQGKDNKAPAGQQVSKENKAGESRITEGSGKGFEIEGTLNDESGNPIVNAQVEVSEQGVVKNRTLTDINGNYSVKSLDGGRYAVKFSYMGKELLIADALVQKKKTKVCGVLYIKCTFTSGDVVILPRRYLRQIPETPGKKTHHAGDNLPPGY